MSPATEKLSKLVTFKTGKLDSNAAKRDGQYPFFTCSRETFRTDTYSFDCECVLLAGNNANGIYPIKYFSGKFDAYQRTYIVRAIDTNKLSNRYLYYAMQPKLDLLKSISTGVATKFLTLTILNDLDLEVPPLSTQRKIAAILTAYDDLIENNTRRIKILEEMAQALYREWFVHFRFPGHEKVKFVASPMGQIPEGWETKNLFEVAEVTYGFPFKSKQFTEQEIGKPVIRIRDIQSSASKTFTDEEAAEKYIVRDGDILVGMDGDFHMGKWAGGEAYLNQRVVRFRPKNAMSWYFLFLALQEPIAHFDATVVGTTVAHLSDEDLRSIFLLVPNEDLSQTVKETFDPVFQLELRLHIQNTNLRRTRDLLLPKLISGEIDVSNLDIRM